MNIGNERKGTLKEELSALRVADLHEIRKRLQVKNASSLKKDDLINKIIESILETIPAILKEFDDERISLFKKLVETNGTMNIKLIETKINYLANVGFATVNKESGVETLSIPVEVKSILEEQLTSVELRQMIKENTEVIQVTRGLLYYYGVLKREQLFEMVKKITQTTMSDQHLERIITAAVQYYGEMKETKEVFSFIAALVPNHVLSEQEKRKDLSYYPFTKEQLMEAGKSDFIEQPKGFTALLKLLKEYHKLPEQTVDMILKLLIIRVKNGQKPSEILQELQKDIKFNDYSEAQVVMEHLIELINHTRQWTLKGYQAVELSNNQPTTKQTQNQKVGRNDPCPCGSGKKHKKCCGK